MHETSSLQRADQDQILGDADGETKDAEQSGNRRQWFQQKLTQGTNSDLPKNKGFVSWVKGRLPDKREGYDGKVIVFAETVAVLDSAREALNKAGIATP